MPAKPPRAACPIHFTDHEVVALINTLNLVINPPDRRATHEDIEQFKHLSSLLKKLDAHERSTRTGTSEARLPKRRR